MSISMNTVKKPLALVLTLVMMCTLTLGLTGCGTDAIKKAATTAVEQTLKPTGELREQSVKNFDSAFSQAAGVTLATLGISNEEFASWLYDETEYKIGKITTEKVDGKETATVEVEVTVHSIDAMEKNLLEIEKNTDASAFVGLQTEAELYQAIGNIMRQAMADTPLATKTVNLKVVKNGNTWEVEKSDAANFVLQVFSS